MRTPTILLSFFISSALALPVVAQNGVTALRDLSDHDVDEAQLRSAVASRTLTWLTGVSANNDYISVGRMANFFGFVALRVSSGQSLTRAHVARDTLAVLKPSQIELLVALLDAQISPHQATQGARIQMNRALEWLLVGDHVDEAEFLALGRTYGAAEAELGRVIAQSFGEIAMTLSKEQQSTLRLIREGHAAGQPITIPHSGNGMRLSDVDRQELVNLAARFLSWTTGSPEFNDFEVVGKPSQHFGFVSLRLASGHAVRRGVVAQQVLDILTLDQSRMLNVSVQQNVDVFDAFLSLRGELMRKLEVALDGQVIDADEVQRLGAAIGEIEAKMTWAQAMAMLNVRDALSEEQLTELLELRATYTVSTSESATQDAMDRGRQLFAQCALCHAPSRDNAVAPSLARIVGRPIASDDDFQHYSPAMILFAETEGNWSTTTLDRFLSSPRSAVPGTTMGFDGLGSARDRAAILAYLATLE
ncbi:hypothetical protein [Cognatiyoonia sp. IB215182]|uniref:c-type cytochrome n=1 Tax=Cognatiyoonia sp. IB215182 TaxID=3097353 RepID=UPI002A13A7E5|nr:hypothetical protein [Cognatiyoonia sp. IB215182]MDX8355241.1 hypothetical protein [Cognatiyoonia sp. IB215182]